MNEKNQKTKNSDAEEPPKEEQPPSIGRTDWVRKNIFRASKKEWEDWRWQLRRRITSLDTLNECLGFNLKLNDLDFNFPMSITPYYFNVVESLSFASPLWNTIIPSKEELKKAPEESDDPLGEDSHSPVKGIVHRYPDRVLFLVTDFCSTYCRYCTRSRMVGKKECYNQTNIDSGIEYIKNHKEVRDVLLSGGDPLTLDTNKLEKIIASVRAIKHVEIIRIGTKVPVVLPQRITKELVKMLKKYQPLYINIHFTHPDEITPEVSKACAMLADAGIPLGSQTVLLKNVNDHAEIMKELMLKLVKIRVRPYYLYACDPIVGSSHFRVPVDEGKAIIKKLQGWITGFAIPKFVIDAPGGGGKIPVGNDGELGKDGKLHMLKNYEDKLFNYVDP